MKATTPGFTNATTHIPRRRRAEPGGRLLTPRKKPQEFMDQGVHSRRCGGQLRRLSSGVATANMRRPAPKTIRGVLPTGNLKIVAVDLQLTGNALRGDLSGSRYTCPICRPLVQVIQPRNRTESTLDL